jgi:isopenicillin-N epimerase
VAVALGAAIRHEWGLDPDFLTVNHGSYGATPLAVLAAQDRWRKRMEAQPTRFFFLELPTALREAAATLARFLGARAEDVVFVPNATTGANAVLRSLRLEAGDEILHASHVYNAVRNTMAYVAERAGAKVVAAEVPFPQPQVETILKNIEQAIGSPSSTTSPRPAAWCCRSTRSSASATPPACRSWWTARMAPGR